MPGSYGNREVTFEIVEEIGVISAHPTGWAKEINMVSWNGGQPKYDIREWSPGHDQMSRGITLNEKEMRLIIELLRRRSRSSLRRFSGGGGRSGSSGMQEAAGGSGAPESGHAESSDPEDRFARARGAEDREVEISSEGEFLQDADGPEQAEYTEDGELLTAEVAEENIGSAAMED